MIKTAWKSTTKALFLSLGFTLIPILTLPACVTVKLGNQENERARGVSFKTPSSPFSSESRQDVDAAFKNSRNGNVISYISDCKDPSDPALESVIKGVLSGLTHLQIKNQKTLDFLGREAIRVEATGKVDGIETAIDLITVKRNNCIYVLTYVGVLKAFPENKDSFEQFLQSFRAP